MKSKYTVKNSSTNLNMPMILDDDEMEPGSLFAKLQSCLKDQVNTILHFDYSKLIIIALADNIENERVFLDE